MKKTYICPEMDVIEIKKQTLLAGSLPLSDSPTIDNSNEILAPEFSEETQIDFFK
jgi:hypothetical protein